MMNRFFTLLLAASCLTAVGQVTYPYNPDGNADGDIAVGDLQDFLTVYGNPFSPSEIMVGDSSLTYWVEQLSFLLQNQQHVIDSLSTATRRMSLGQTVHFRFHMLEWSQTENSGYRTMLNFENDGFARITGGNAGIKFVVVPDSTSLELIADDDAAEANFSDTFWEGQNPALTIALSSNETLVMFGGSGVLEEETTAGEMQLNWKPMLQQETVVSDEEPAEDNLGPCQDEFTVNYDAYDYELVEIGEQCWFAENLRSGHYANGDSIVSGLTNGQWVTVGEGAFFSYAESFGLEPDESCIVRFEIGHLYNGFAVLDERRLCPSGFHVAGVSDWETLILNSGGEFMAGHNLKASPDDVIPWDGSNFYGFNALFGGFRSGSTGNYGCSSSYPRGYYWTSTETGVNRMQFYSFWDETFTVESSDTEKSVGYAIRCIKDVE